MLNKSEIQNIIALINRADIKGQESVTVANLIVKLSKMANPVQAVPENEVNKKDAKPKNK